MCILQERGGAPQDWDIIIRKIPNVCATEERVRQELGSVGGAIRRVFVRAKKTTGNKQSWAYGHATEQPPTIILVCFAW